MSAWASAVVSPPSMLIALHPNQDVAVGDGGVGHLVVSQDIGRTGSGRRRQHSWPASLLRARCRGRDHSAGAPTMHR
jgi:hypothetical protein